MNGKRQPAPWLLRTVYGPVWVGVKSTSDLPRGAAFGLCVAYILRVSAVAHPNARPSCLIVGLAIILVAWTGCAASEVTRVKRPGPSPEEAQNIAVDIAKNDGLLREGDIIVTPRGFLVFKGVASDGYTHEFEPVPNPLNQNRGRKN